MLRAARVAWAESPLQLINAIELASSAHRDDAQRTLVLWRRGPRQLAETAAWLAPHARDIARLDSATNALDPRFRRARTRVIGDAFSGQVRAVLAASRMRETVVVDDGTAALHLAAALAGSLPFGRMGQREALPQRVLGTIARHRLRTAARRGRLVLFTAYAAGVDVDATRGARIVSNDYAWLRGLEAAPPHALRPTVVLGTALAVDGYVDTAAYEAWAATVAPGATYLPHRRESEASLARLEGAGLEVIRPVLPAEIVLGLAHGVRAVHSLPSSTNATLRGLLRGPALHVQPVPEHWWTPAADGPLRQTMRQLAGVAREEDTKGS